MPRTIQGIVAVLGRVLLCTIFLLSAVGMKIPKFSDTADMMAHHGIPMAKFMLVGAIVFELAGTLSVVLGYKPRIGATLLLIFLVLATYYFHDFWDKTDPKEVEQQMTHFLKNLGLMGAMLLIIANGTGPMSLDERFAKKVDTCRDRAESGISRFSRTPRRPARTARGAGPGCRR